MNDKDWSGEIPSWTETMQRAADEREARRDRIAGWITVAAVSLFVLALAAVVALMGGGLR